MVRALAAALLGALLTATMVSCGGASFEGDDDGVAGGASGGASSAGKGGASSAGKGGMSSGGSTSGGGTTGVAGSGSGGSPPDLCSLPPESGNCNAFFPSFFHNSATGVCEPFIYGGCGGNANLFDSIEACQAACSGGMPDMDSCQSPLDCVLVNPHCCGACDGGLENYTAVNAASQQAFRDAHVCGDVACEPCPPTDPTIANRPYLTATCRNGACVPIDVRLEGVTDCLTDEDCHVRAGVGCCESCGGVDSEIVAVGNETRLAELVCGDQLPPCLACEPTYPPNLSASCGVDRCVLSYAP